MNEWLEGDKIVFILGLIFCVLILTWVVSLGIFFAATITEDFDELEDMFNPIAMYDNSNLNIFGVTVLTIICYIIFFPAAILFWFYKLCTFGRR